MTTQTTNLLMGVGLAVVKWPLLSDAQDLPLLVALPTAVGGSLDAATTGLERDTASSVAEL